MPIATETGRRLAAVWPGLRVGKPLLPGERPGWPGAVITRFRIAFALFALHAIVTMPWAIGNWGFSVLGALLLLCWLVLALIALPLAQERFGLRRYWMLLLGTLILSRLAAFSLVGGAVVAGDPGIYIHLARSILAGNGLVFHDPITRVDFHALYPPAYPLLLAGLGATVGLDGSTIWASNVAIDLASAFILLRIGASLGSEAAGRAAAWLFAIWPAFIFATPFAQKEGLVTLEVLAAASVLLDLDRSRRPSWSQGALLGAATAALMLTQPGLALLPVILGLVLCRRMGRACAGTLLLRAAPVALLFLAPWWVRNFHVLGSFVPLTTTGGLGLWVGNNPDATGNWMPMAQRFWNVPELEMSRLAARDALRWISGNPLNFISLTLFKLFHALGIEQFTLARFGLMTPKPGPAMAAALFPMLQGSLIAILAGSALTAGRVPLRYGGDRLILILCGCAVQILFFSLPFEFGERHRFFLMPFLFLLIAAAMIRRPPAGGGKPGR